MMDQVKPRIMGNQLNLQITRNVPTLCLPKASFIFYIAIFLSACSSELCFYVRTRPMFVFADISVSSGGQPSSDSVTGNFDQVWAMAYDLQKFQLFNL